jgi:hypothetical protein
MDTGEHVRPTLKRGEAILGKVDLLKRGASSTATQGGVSDWRDREAGG